jgi:hypothetical protein
MVQFRNNFSLAIFRCLFFFPDSQTEHFLSVKTSLLPLSAMFFSIVSLLLNSNNANTNSPMLRFMIRRLAERTQPVTVLLCCQTTRIRSHDTLHLTAQLWHADVTEKHAELPFDDLPTAQLRHADVTCKN